MEEVKVSETKQQENPTEEELVAEVNSFKEKPSSSQFYRRFLEQLRSFNSNNANGSTDFKTLLSCPEFSTIENIVLYGVGSLLKYKEDSMSQLSLMLLIVHDVPALKNATINVYDPVLSSLEIEVLKLLGCNPLHSSKAWPWRAKTRTLFYMPRNPLWLYDWVLRDNWGFCYCGNCPRQSIVRMKGSRRLSEIHCDGGCRNSGQYCHIGSMLHNMAILGNSRAAYKRYFNEDVFSLRYANTRNIEEHALWDTTGYTGPKNPFFKHTWHFFPLPKYQIPDQMRLIRSQMDKLKFKGDLHEAFLHIHITKLEEYFALLADAGQEYALSEEEKKLNLYKSLPDSWENMVEKILATSQKEITWNEIVNSVELVQKECYTSF